MATIMPPRQRFGPNICTDLTEANQREWLVTNGLGGYASGTLSGILSRRYHGLLIANLTPPLNRYLVFSKANTTLIDGDKQTPIYADCWAEDQYEPKGYRYIQSFELDGRMPVWRFQIGDTQLEMRIWMEPGANTTYIAYRLEPSADAYDKQLQVKCDLWVNARDHHSLPGQGAFESHVHATADTLAMDLPGDQQIYFKTKDGSLVHEPVWKENYFLQEEQLREMPCIDSHLSIGHAVIDLQPGRWVGFAASLHEDASTDLRAALNRFRGRDIENLKRAKSSNKEFIQAPDWVERLLLAADSFIFSRWVEDLPSGESIIAGYPWYDDLGRQTMIALPGLTLATGRHQSARRILQTYGRFVEQGMLPNSFPGNGEEPQYANVDAALWYIEAWRSYLKATQDLRSLHKIYPVLQRIIIACLKGTRHGIIMDPDDGLVYCGEPGSHLTWMDSEVSGVAVTPRIGKPVEINALWFNAVNTMTKFAYQLGLNPNPYGDLVKKTLRGIQRYVRAKHKGLYDVLDGPAGHDDTVRPNQILAVSLPYSALEYEAMADVVKVCNQSLLTPYGLRSLSPDHPQYQPRAKGNPALRESGLHQGSVWAWLLGHYALAEYRVHNDPLAAQSRLSGLQNHLHADGLGFVGEVFDGAPPHASRGAIAQAWSVAGVLEAWWKLEKAKKLVQKTEPRYTQERLQRLLVPQA